MAKKSAKKRPRKGGAPGSRAGSPNAKKLRNKPRRDPSEPTREERWAAAKAERHRKARLRQAAAVALGVLVLAGLVTWQVTNRRNAQRTIAALTSGSCKYDTETDPGPTTQHVPSASYRLNPPSGGPHIASAASAGVYTAENAPEDSLVVHAFEHGYISVFYRPDLPAPEVKKLTKFARDNANDVLLLPRPTLPEPVAASAWRRRLLCGELEMASLNRFLDAYVGKGPEKVRRG